ncbi:hypothetical protein VNO77_19253 [Canavalia gladiata]|uniref:Uncharacterized protein n=1 Tax=Canavalia gladiata TaxID=3824 RepID=A0AAN9LR77_CANGL
MVMCVGAPTTEPNAHLGLWHPSLNFKVNLPDLHELAWHQGSEAEDVPSLITSGLRLCILWNYVTKYPQRCPKPFTYVNTVNRLNCCINHLFIVMDFVFDITPRN